MAAGTRSAFTINNEYLRTRISELMAQNGDALNAASNGAIRLDTISRRGDFVTSSFFTQIANLVVRRDPTSVADVDDTPMGMSELVTVKTNRRIGPVAMTWDAFKKMQGQFTETEFTGLVAVQAAQAMQLEMLNTGILAARAALRQQSASYLTEASLGRISSQTLIDALAKMGDQASRIVAWVMHSKVYYDLVGNQLAANITGVSNFNIATGTPVTVNRPVIVTDSDSLFTNIASPDVTNYFTLGLVRDAVALENSEEEDIVSQTITGKENLIQRYQGEYAYNIGILGFSWDTQNGGVNPTTTALGTGTNWDPAFTDVKNRAGVAIMTL